MQNGNDSFEKALLDAEELASRYELQLPHVSDTIYSLVKLVREFDGNIHKLIKLYVSQSKDVKTYIEILTYASRFLTPREIGKIKRHIKKWKKKHMKKKGK